METKELDLILNSHKEWLNDSTKGTRANLSRADLSGANLSGANLSWADLSGANLSRANNIPELPQTKILPEGELIVYKKTREGIVKLLIPADAKRSNATTRKCRAEFAIVLETPNHQPAHGLFNSTFLYQEKERVTCNLWDDKRWNECSGGIHFFITREEAEEYTL